MAIIEINRDPSRRELMWFGGIVALFCALVGLLFRFRLGLETASTVTWIVGAAVAAVFYAVPPIRRSLYVGWMYLFYPIGFVLSHIVLGVIYYVAITPIGLVMGLVKRDSMQRKSDADAGTYWVERDTDISSERYFRQF